MSFTVFFAFSRTVADNRLPAGKRRTRRQRQDLIWLVVVNCAQAAPGGLLTMPLGEIGHMSLEWRLLLASLIGWVGLDETMKRIEFIARRKLDGSSNCEAVGDPGRQLGTDDAGSVQADQ
jgi:hypothetical protein